ncbi:transposase [uncultured Oscillibacter sp.]|uniref:transposase n=1 Tax=uncultured Oscillibacter sp. TaxID=876091 RepID=UPI00342E87CA
MRCKVEHPYRIVKNIFGFRKTVYRGLRKNLNRLHVLFASANLYMLARAGGSLCPA